MLVCLLAMGTAAALANAADDRSPDGALAQLLAGVRAGIPASCSANNADRLIRIVCAGRIRVGVRSNYPQFAEQKDNQWHGYEIDLARAVAGKLSVAAEFVTVTPANRTSELGQNHIDAAIAAIGHNTQRDGQARFIRPHYYRSDMVLVGPRDLVIDGWSSIAGRTICVTVGNGSNAKLSSRGARLMLFGSPGQLLDELSSGTCSLIAQDDSFLAAYFSQPDFASRYSTKLRFAPVPWGIAVARDGSEQLGRALALIVQIFHRDGTLAEIARANHIATGFLAAQQDVWRRPECDTAAGSNQTACVLPPLDAELEPTRFAGRISDAEAWISSQTGLRLSLPMLKTVQACSLLRRGVINSLVLIAGALFATLTIALTFAALLSAHSYALRWSARLLVIVLQSMPPVMALVIASAILNRTAGYSLPALLAAVIAALGLINGANAGQAISEAITTLRAEMVVTPEETRSFFIRGIGRSAMQIESFLVNAAKGTPIASFIGTPDLLNALTDITSFSSERATTYSLLLMFYIVIVIAVVRLCAMLRSLLDRQEAWG